MSSRGLPRGRARQVDLALATALLVLGQAEVALRGVSGSALAAHAMWGAAAVAVLGWRRWPVAFAVWAGVVFLLGSTERLDPSASAIVGLYAPLGLFGLGNHVRDPRRANVAAALGVVGFVALMAGLDLGGYFDASPDHYLRSVSIVAAAGVGGVVLRDRTEMLLQARVRVGSAATGDTASVVDRALTGERTRIARELHAIVTGCVRAVLDEVAAARSQLASTGAARAALLRARGASQQAMEEMRRMLALLRTDAGTASDAADLPASLAELIDRSPLGHGAVVVSAHPGVRDVGAPLVPGAMRVLAALAALPGSRSLRIERSHRGVRARVRLTRALAPAPLEALAERVRIAGGRLCVRRWTRGRVLAVELGLVSPTAIAPPHRHGWQRWIAPLRGQGMPLLVLVVGVGEALLAHGKPVEHYGAAGVPLRVAGAVALALAFVPRRRWPLLTVVAVGALLIVRTTVLGDGFGLNLSAYLAAFTAGAYLRPLWLSAVAGAVPIVCGVLAVVMTFDWDLQAYPVNLMLFFATMTGAAWLTGVGGRRKLAEIDELHALQALEQRRGERAVEAAVTAERRRVARELHDLVGHGLTSITLQSAVAAQLLEPRPAQAAAAIDAVEEVGQEVLRELYQLLAALDGEREADAPQLARLPELIRRAAADGLPVRLELDGDVRRVPPGQAGAAYRIVQEALTNARKHGGAAPVTARVACRRDRVAIEVCSGAMAAREAVGAGEPQRAAVGGATAWTAANGSAPSHQRAADPWSGGHGLLGMRERVRVYDGRLAAGPGDDGAGWVVRAELPLTGAV